MSAEDLTTHASSLAHIVSFMIENANILFDFPVEFMDDVRLHSKRDPEEDASSTASTPPVKTTITFVDRYILNAILKLIVLMNYLDRFKGIALYVSLREFSKLYECLLHLGITQHLIFYPIC